MRAPERRKLEEQYQRAIRTVGVSTIKGYYETYGKKASMKLLLGAVSELNVWEFLALLWAADAHLKKLRVFSTPFGLSVDAVAFLAKAAVLNSRLEGGKKPDERLIDSLCLIYRDLESEQSSDVAHLLVEGGDIPKGLAAVVRQSSVLGALSWESRETDRACLIYEEMLRIGDRAEIERQAIAVLGTDFKSYAAAGLALMTLSSESPWIDLSDESKFPKGDALPIIRGFLKGASASVAEIRAKYAGKEAEFYSLNPLFEFPLIRREDGKLIPPVWTILLRKYTSNIYHTFFNALREPFSRQYGDAFQAYVGRVLRAGSEDSKVHPEVQYGPKKARVLSCDWFVVEGKDLLLIECKNKRFRQKATKETGSYEELKEDLRKGISHGVDQAHRSANQLRAGVEEFEFARHCRRLIPVVVVPEWNHFDNLKAVKDIIRSLLEDPVTPGVEEFVTIGVDELECGIAASRATGDRLSQMIRKWRESLERSQQSFGHYLEAHYSDFDTKMPVLKEEYERLGDELTKRFFSEGNA